MILNKFKVGDKVMAIDARGYEFSNGRNLKAGDIVTISDINIEDGDIVYGFKEDTENSHAHWLRVEENFKLAKRSSIVIKF
jgi:hypothetical protein